jgi:hypothetical protein
MPVDDVIGFPALASASTERGLLARGARYGGTAATLAKLMPIGIYTIP